MHRTLQATLSHQLPQLVRQVVLCTNYGSRRIYSSRWIYDNTTKPCHKLGKAFKRMANAVCYCLLWNRTDGNSIKSVRFGPIWSRSLSIQSSTSRFVDSCWTDYDQNDACTPANLYSDDRAQVGHFNGSMRFYGRVVRYVRCCAGSRSIPSSRRLCTRLPSQTRDAHRGSNGDTANHRRGQYPIRWRRETQTAKTRPRCAKFLHSRYDYRRFLTKRKVAQYVTNTIAILL